MIAGHHIYARWETIIYWFWEQFSTWTHTIEPNLFLLRTDSAKLEYSGKIQRQD